MHTFICRVLAILFLVLVSSNSFAEENILDKKDDKFLVPTPLKEKQKDGENYLESYYVLPRGDERVKSVLQVQVISGSILCIPSNSGTITNPYSINQYFKTLVPNAESYTILQVLKETLRTICVRVHFAYIESNLVTPLEELKEERKIPTVTVKNDL